MTLIHSFHENTIKRVSQYPKVRPGMTVKIYQRIIEETEKGSKERTQVYEGLVIARRGRAPATMNITVRKISHGVGVERIFPIASPTVEKIEVLRQAKIRRSKLYYLRDLRGKASRLKEFNITDQDIAAVEEKHAEEKNIHDAKLQRQSAGSTDTAPADTTQKNRETASGTVNPDQSKS